MAENDVQDRLEQVVPGTNLTLGDLLQQFAQQFALGWNTPSELFSQTGDGGSTEDGGVPEFDITDPTIQGVLASILSGSGGGSGGGGGTVDPTVSAAEQFYFQLWGRKAPRGYVSGFISAGHDLQDFMTWQLSRPEAQREAFFRDEYARYASVLARVMGRR